MEAVINLNNHAVRLLSRKQVQAATRVLRDAFVDFRTLEQQQEQQGQQPNPLQAHDDGGGGGGGGDDDDGSNENDNENGEEANDDDDDDVPFCIRPVRLHSDLQVSCHALSPNNDFTFYPYAFALPERSSDETAVAVVLVYNLALARLCLGMQTTNHGVLRKTIDLFANALAVDQSSITSGLELVTLATLMNQGFLSSHFLLQKDVLQTADRILNQLRSDRMALSGETWLFFFVPSFHIQEWGLITMAPSV